MASCPSFLSFTALKKVLFFCSFRRCCLHPHHTCCDYYTTFFAACQNSMLASLFFHSKNRLNKAIYPSFFNRHFLKFKGYFCIKILFVFIYSHFIVFRGSFISTVIDSHSFILQPLRPRLTSSLSHLVLHILIK